MANVNKVTPIETYTLESDGIEARIFVNTEGGYTVTLCDLDSGETLPTAFKTKDLAAARKKAQKLVVY